VFVLIYFNRIIIMYFIYLNDVQDYHLVNYKKCSVQPMAIEYIILKQNVAPQDISLENFYVSQVVIATKKCYKIIIIF